jgi:hypothetical protein
MISKESGSKISMVSKIEHPAESVMVITYLPARTPGLVYTVPLRTPPGIVFPGSDCMVTWMGVFKVALELTKTCATPLASPKHRTLSTTTES